MSKLGDFYNYIALESYVLSDSDYGDNDYYTWSTYTSCWAARIEQKAEEKLANNQISTGNEIIWKVRYDSNITENMRIYFDGNYYDITGIEIEGRNKFMILNTHKWTS